MIVSCKESQRHKFHTECFLIVPFGLSLLCIKNCVIELPIALDMYTDHP